MNNGETNGQTVFSGKGTSTSAEQLVRQVHEELLVLLRQRAEIIRRICTAKRTISGLCTLFGDGMVSPEMQRILNGGARGRHSGFTKTCRAILMDADRALTVREVRDRILERDPALLSRQKDPLSSITTILKRLVDYGEAQKIVDDGGRTWRWAAESDDQSYAVKGDLRATLDAVHRDNSNQSQ